jgi:hypothetical protein
MKESYDQDPASQVGPESCGDGREAVVEALTGERAGRVLNRDIVNVRGADAHVGARKATSLIVSISRETGEPREVEDPEGRRLPAFRCTHRSISQGRRFAPPAVRKPGDLTLGHWQLPGPRRESLVKEQDDDERA